ncbi:PAS domain S-box protein [Methylobacterium aquaticum]|uniref:PAS domain S-box protein n=1 Tax=Methylobacterium aquaticum TaxID=270351 RepID=UPI003D164BED
MSRPSDPPIAVCDPDRLAALDSYAILDTLPEQGFDDVVRLASRVCDTPVALVSLVAGSRQWFKARTGFPFPQTDLSRSVCAHALTHPGALFVIPDLSEDPRTRDNPLVTASPGIRFYAGAPLRTPGGQVLGTLCVIDYVPRPEGLTAAEAGDLVALARQVMGQFALRRAVAEHQTALRVAQAAEERYRRAAQATRDAIWDWDFSTDHVLWNEALETAYGHAPADVAPTGLWWIDHIHPDDRARIDASVHAVIDGADTIWSDEYRFRRADGSYAHVFDRGSVIRDEAGRAVRMIGAMLDLTERHRAEAERRESERRLALFAEQSSDFIAIADADGQIVYLNQAGRALVGLSEDAARAARLTDVFTPDDLPVAVATILPATRSAGSWSGEFRLRNLATGAVVPVRYSLFALRGAGGAFEGFAAVSHDISARKAAEAQQEILNRELSHRLKNTLAMVQAIAVQTLRNATDPAAAREALVARLVALGKAHDILLTGEGEGADLRAVLDSALAIHDDGRPGRFRLQGPPVPCGARAALSLALMAHELATNAVKYGALRSPDGHVTLDWTITDPADPVLALRWQEHGGPRVTPPSRKGFGSRLIERGLAGTVDGEVATHYPPEGVVCTLTAPLAELRRGE